MSRPQMFLVGGVNGAGKSTLTRTIRRRFSSLQVIDPDAIARTLTGSFETIDKARFSAGKEALITVRNCIDQGWPFITESTLSGAVYLKHLQRAKDAGFRTILVYVALSSAGLSAQRVRDRVADGGHDIPEVDIKRRYPKSFAALKAHLRLCDAGYIYDNSDDFRFVASFRNGTIRRRDHIPAWLTPYL